MYCILKIWYLSIAGIVFVRVDNKRINTVHTVGPSGYTMNMTHVILW